MRYFLVLALLVSNSALAECADSQRFVHGNEPLASKLYEATKAIPHGAWDDGEFGDESFHYLGALKVAGKSTFVTYINTTWGAGSCSRATSRLIFFDEQLKEVGQYYGVQQPKLEKSLLVYPKGEIGSSSVDVSTGLPEQLNDGNDYYPISIY
ncbi:hypothetical protein [Aliikangiella sp. IMCC44632]